MLGSWCLFDRSGRQQTTQRCSLANLQTRKPVRKLPWKLGNTHRHTHTHTCAHARRIQGLNFHRVPCTGFHTNSACSCFRLDACSCARVSLSLCIRKLAATNISMKVGSLRSGSLASDIQHRTPANQTYFLRACMDHPTIRLFWFWEEKGPVRSDTRTVSSWLCFCGVVGFEFQGLDCSGLWLRVWGLGLGPWA